MKARHFLFLALAGFLFLASPALLAQESSVFNTQSEPLLNKPKTDFGLQLGTSFSTGFAGSSLFSQSIAPHFQFNPTQRFSLVLGTVFSSGQLTGSGGFSPFGFTPFGESPAAHQQLFSTTVYAMGAYQLNPRLTITGASWVERNNFNMAQPQMNSQAFNFGPRGMMVGFDYRITENLSFGAQVRMSQGYNQFNQFHSPFQRGFMGTSPFSRNPIW